MTDTCYTSLVIFSIAKVIIIITVKSMLDTNIENIRQWNNKNGYQQQPYHPINGTTTTLLPLLLQLILIKKTNEKYGIDSTKEKL